MDKAGLIGLVKLRLLPSDDNLSLRRDTLRDAIELDKQNGLIPFFVWADDALVIMCLLVLVWATDDALITIYLPALCLGY